MISGTFADFKAAYQPKRDCHSFKGRGYRLVETQEYAATSAIVDDLDEQSLLEGMLDKVKPRYRSGTEDMHYLLKTPFRYPPLAHGSRFGAQTMPSFFYAGESLHTTLAEVAYYRFVFLADMQTPYDDAIQSAHTAFCIAVSTKQCIDLVANQWADFTDQLTDPEDYRFTQRLGDWFTQEQKGEVIRYPSARFEHGINLAIYAPRAIVSDRPQQRTSWLCHTHREKVSFTEHGTLAPISFTRQDFLVDGRLPRPA